MIKRLLLLLLLASPCWASFRSIGTATSTTNGTASWTPGSPAGLAANDIIICFASADSTGETFSATGFTSLYNTSIATPDGQSTGALWKLAAGGDSLTITRSSTTASAVAQCAAWSVRGSPPVGSTAATNTATNASPLTVTANGVTALAGDDLVWFGGLDITLSATIGQTAPTGFTNRATTKDTTDGLDVFVVASEDNVTAGATGSVSGTITYTTGSAGYAAFLIRIPAIASAGPNGGFTGKPGCKGKCGLK